MAITDVYVELRATIADFQAKFALAEEQITVLEATQSRAAVKMSESSALAGAAMTRQAEETVVGTKEIDAGLNRATLAYTKLAAGAESARAANKLATAQMSADMSAMSAKMEADAGKAAAANDAIGVSAEKAAVKSREASAAHARSYGMVAAAAAAVAVVAVDMAAKYETVTTRLVTSAGESAAGLKVVSAGMLDMAGQVGIGAAELAKGMYTVESAGFHAKDGLDVLRAAAQGAKDEGASLKTVADALSTVLKDYHLPAGEAANVTSQLVEAVAHGKTTMEEFAGSLSAITPMAAAMGIKLADVTGTLAEMTSHGMSAQQASQDLAQALRSLQKPTGPMINELSQLHMTTQELKDALSNKGLAGTINDLSERILNQMGPSGTMLLSTFNQSKDAAANMKREYDAMTPSMKKLADGFNSGTLTGKEFLKAIHGLPAEQSKLMSQYTTLAQKAQGFNSALNAGGPASQTYTTALQSVMGTAPGYNAALMITKDNAADVAKNIKDIGEATADSQGNVKGFAEIQGTLQFKLDSAKASLGALGIKIGDVLLPAVSRMADGLSKVVGWLERHPNVATAAAIGIGVLALAFTGLSIAMWAASLTPIALIIAAIVAAVALLALGVYELIKHWGDVKRFFEDLWKGVEHAFSSAIHGIGKMLDGWGTSIEGAWSDVKHAFSSGVEAVGKSVSGFFDDLGKFPGKVGAALSSFGGELGKAATDGWRGFVDAMKIAGRETLRFLEDLPHNAGEALGALAGILVTAAVKGWRGFHDGIISGTHATLQFFRDLPGNIQSFFADVGSWLSRAGTELWNGAQRGVEAAYKATTKWLWDLPGHIGGFFSDVGSWLYNAGRDLGNGLGRGLGYAWNATAQWLWDLPGNVGRFFSNAGSWLYNAGIDLGNGLGRGIGDAWKATAQWLWDLPGNVGRFFSNAGSWLYNAGRDILIGLWRGIESLGDWVWKQMSDFSSALVDGFKRNLHINSPSLVFADIGSSIVEGLGNGITDNTHKAVTAATAMAARVVGASNGMTASLSIAGGSVSPLGAATGGTILGSSGSSSTPVVNIYVQGSVHSEESLRLKVTEIFQQHAGRNQTNGLTSARF